MDKINDIIGKRFERLVVKSFHHANGYIKYYVCQCDCGNEKVIARNNLLAGYTKSCGCLQKERAAQAHKLPEHYHQLHHVLQGMKNRCYNKENNRYHRYGERGITVCDEWLNNPDTFCEWAIANGYKKGLSIDRINNDGNYEPNNCRWVTPKEQNTNQSTNINITYNGITQTLSQWACQLGIKKTTLHNRIKYYGWSVEDALTKPVRNY